MPIYDYLCTACDHRADILHGINDPGPLFCPSCGAEGSMRKQFAAPTIHFKGSGWAKKDRGASGATRAGNRAAAGNGDRESKTEGGASSSTSSASASDSSSSSAGSSDSSSRDSSSSGSSGSGSSDSRNRDSSSSGSSSTDSSKPSGSSHS